MLLQKGNILFPAITAAAADLGEGVRPHLFKGALRTPRSAQEDMRLRIFILGTCYLFGAVRRVMIDRERSGDGRCRT